MNTLLNLDDVADPETAAPPRRLQHRFDPRQPGPQDPETTVQDAHAESSLHPPREFTLGTATILGIFFALAALCAVFFAFGYSLGSKRGATGPAVAAAPAIPFSTTPKPSPINPYAPPTAKPASALPTVSVTVPAQPAARSAESTPNPRTAAAPASAAVAPATETPSTPGTAIVQVAAVSHQEDADIIATTLTRRGYAVAVRNEPQDKLLHIQLGPFPTRKDADAMRLRLQADGFNAYIK